MVWPDSVAWHELVALTVVGDGREHSMVGRVHTRKVVELEDDVTGPDVVVLDAAGRVRVIEQDLRVWKQGQRLRLESMEGQPRMIVGHDTRWAWLDGSTTPTAFDPRTSTWGSGLENLLERRGYDAWSGDDFTHPVGDPVADEFLGRPAWRIELAPPTHKRSALTWIVDAQTGMVLSQVNEGFTTVEEWIELRLDVVIADEVFDWPGAALPPPSYRAERERETTSRNAWLISRGIANLPLAAPAILSLHEWSDDGSFQASVEADLHGSLLRRPHREDAWDEELGWPHIERWTDDRWDWLLGTNASMDDAALADLSAGSQRRPDPTTALPPEGLQPPLRQLRSAHSWWSP